MVCGHDKSWMRGLFGCGIFSRHRGEFLYLPGLWSSSPAGEFYLGWETVERGPRRHRPVGSNGKLAG